MSVYQAKYIKITQAIVDKAYQMTLSAGKNPSIRNVQDEIEILTGKRGSMDDVNAMLKISKEGGEKPLPKRVTDLENEVAELKAMLIKCMSQLVQ